VEMLVSHAPLLTAAAVKKAKPSPIIVRHLLAQQSNDKAGVFNAGFFVPGNKPQLRDAEPDGT